MFDREMALFRLFQARGVEISLLSYGGREELDFASRIPGMEILCNRASLPRQTYIRRIHQAHVLPLLRCSVLRNWQASGLFSAHRASWAWQTPMVARMDYFWSELARLRQAAGSRNADRIAGQERKALASAARIIATSEEMAAYLIDRSPSLASRITIIPNFVDVDRFKPLATAKKFDLVFVGRVSPEKNLPALLQALRQLDASIAIVGGTNLTLDAPSRDNDEEAKLKRDFGTLDGRIHWIGRVKNEELPAILNQSRAFALSSLIEGQPRVLIEAMACGLPIIGTKAPGIRGLIQHEATGYLCDTDADSIAAAISAVLSNPELMNRMGAKARQFALENYSLEELARREYELLRHVVSRFPLKSAPMRLAEYVLRRNPPYDRTASAAPN